MADGMISTGWIARVPGTALAALLAALLGGCGRAPEEAPPLQVGFTDSRDLEQATDEATGLGLTRRDARGRVVSGLAQSWRISNDGSFAIFRLRPILAAGGRAVEASDVVRALEGAVRSPGHAAARDLLGGAIDVRAPLPEVIEIRLTTPQPELPDLLALPEMAIRPTGSGRRRTPRLPGPLMEAEPAESEGKGRDRAPAHSLLVPDPGFGLAENAMPEAGVKLLRLDPEPAVALFLEGRLDLVVGGLMRGLDDAARIPERQGLVVVPARAVARLAVNQSAGPLADRRVRQALAMAVDREGLAEAFGAPATRPLAGLIPPMISGRAVADEPESSRAALAGRQEEARQRLAEAGHGPGAEALRLRLAAGRSREETRLIEKLANDWAQIGVEVVAERRSVDGLRKAIEAGQIELALELVESPVDAPTLFLSRLPCGRNRLGICLPEADKLWQASWTAPTLAERLAAVEAAHRLWLDDAAMIPLFQPARWWLVSPRIANWAPGVDSVHGLAHIRRDQR